MAYFAKKIQNFSSQYNLWEKKSKIIIGVSGGPDSVCLLDFFYGLKKKYNFELQIAHVNYGLREKDSDDDEKFVRKLGLKYEIKVNVLKPDKPLYKGNLENSLRNARYDFFEKLRSQEKYDLIAVAHNQDDQAETVLMRMLRGTGLNGLGAMKPKNGNIIRPLLKTSKKDILLYLKEKKLHFRIDKTNNERIFTRNKIRHELFPLLEKDFNPVIKNTLCELSLSIADDYDYIYSQANKFVLKKIQDGIFFDSELFSKKHLSIQRQIVRRVIHSLVGTLNGLEYAQVEEILKVIKSSKSKAKKAFIGGLNISKKGGKVEILHEK
jgi:tRNA(Ile)-lysidine synthase